MGLNDEKPVEGSKLSMTQVMSASKDNLKVVTRWGAEYTAQEEDRVCCKGVPDQPMVPRV